ncbi:MAG: ATP-binding protein [Myxococcota bacterium]
MDRTAPADVLATDQSRRERAAFTLAIVVAVAGGVIAARAFLTGDDVLGWLVAALCLPAVGLVFVARRGYPDVIGGALAVLLGAGSVVGVILVGKSSLGGVFPVLGVLVALATMRGWPQIAAITFSIASSLAAVIIARVLDLPAASAAQTNANSVTFALVALAIVAVHVTSHRWLLRTLSAEAEAAMGARRDAAESEARYRLLADNTVDLITLLDRDGRTLYASPSWQRVLGCAPGAVDGLHSRVLEADRHLVDAALGEARAGHVSRCEARLLSSTGAPRWFESLFSPVAGRDLVACVSRDITEARALAERLQQAQKMEALGRLAGGIAHDFNNLLSVMQTCTALALDALPPDSPVREDLEDVRTAQGRAADLTRQLLAFSRREVVVPRRIDVGASLAGILELLRRLTGPGVTLETHLEPDLWPLWAGPSQLEQIVLNLGINARGAMPDGGRLVIRAGNHVDPALGEVVRLIVRDTGTGMDEETRRRLFEPFFTTKASGTGLGLSTVFGLVESLGGRIEVDSAPGQGTEFRVLLPRARQEAAAPETEAPAQAGPGQRAIAVVDDEPAVLSLLVRVLTAAGHRVVAQASTAEELLANPAVAQAEVLVTDVALPGQDGVALARALLARRPDLDVVLVSGFAPDPEATGRLVAAGARFLAKPFAPVALLDAVRARPSARENLTPVA